MAKVIAENIKASRLTGRNNGKSRATVKNNGERRAHAAQRRQMWDARRGYDNQSLDFDD